MRDHHIRNSILTEPGVGKPLMSKVNGNLRISHVNIVNDVTIWVNLPTRIETNSAINDIDVSIVEPIMFQENEPMLIAFKVANNNSSQPGHIDNSDQGDVSRERSNIDGNGEQVQDRDNGVN